jgi:uncharacterized damage-inducible protein DinB
MKQIAGVLVLLVLAAGPALAQTAAPAAQANPLIAGSMMPYGGVKGYITKAAEKMPEEQYSFKPADTVRTFGQLIGHIADANYMFCSAVLGEKSPVDGVEKSKTTKAELVQAVTASFAYCDKAWGAITDATAAQTVKFFNNQSPKLSVLTFNTAHDFEHYGNIVTYLRMKGIVPPSSERGGM